MATTSYGNFASNWPDSGSEVTLGAYVSAALGEYASDYDVDALTGAYRDAVNAALAGSGISMHGDEFYGPHPVADDAGSIITAAIESIGFWQLADLFKRAAR